jgi:hypothetical protein
MFLSPRPACGEGERAAADAALGLNPPPHILLLNYTPGFDVKPPSSPAGARGHDIVAGFIGFGSDLDIDLGSGPAVRVGPDLSVRRDLIGTTCSVRRAARHQQQRLVDGLPRRQRGSFSKCRYRSLHLFSPCCSRFWLRSGQIGCWNGDTANGRPKTTLAPSGDQCFPAPI